jgi:hypothetical protein
VNQQNITTATAIFSTESVRERTRFAGEVAREMAGSRVAAVIG